MRQQVLSGHIRTVLNTFGRTLLQEKIHRLEYLSEQDRYPSNRTLNQEEKQLIFDCFIIHQISVWQTERQFQFADGHEIDPNIGITADKDHKQGSTSTVPFILRTDS